MGDSTGAAALKARLLPQLTATTVPNSLVGDEKAAIRIYSTSDFTMNVRELHSRGFIFMISLSLVSCIFSKQLHSAPCWGQPEIR